MQTCLENDPWLSLWDFSYEICLWLNEARYMLTLCHDNRVILMKFEANWLRVAHVKESEIVIAGVFFFLFGLHKIRKQDLFFFPLSVAAMVTDMGMNFCLSQQTLAWDTERESDWNSTSENCKWNLNRQEKHMFSQINEKCLDLWLILTDVRTQWSSDSISNESDSALQCPPMVRTIFV